MSSCQQRLSCLTVQHPTQQEVTAGSGLPIAPDIRPWNRVLQDAGGNGLLNPALRAPPPPPACAFSGGI